MSEKASGIPRYREFDGPIVFRHGFRPFFVGAGVWALAAIVIWFPVLEGDVSLPTAFALTRWHAHEMIFGYVAATIAGFLLTAIPNWTGRMPLQGLSLITLFAAWVLGRIAVSVSQLVGPEIAAVLDLSFLGILLGAVLREILAGKNWRNLPMPVALGGLLIANAMMHAEAVGIAQSAAFGERLAVAIVVMLIGLIGGRIIPSFTLNWLKKRGDQRIPAKHGRFDVAALALLGGALACWIVAPQGRLAGVTLIVVGLIFVVRLARWRGYLTYSEPLVWALHLGFAWVPIGLLLTGLSALGSALPASAGLHALTAGAIASMTLAVMTRATLGHTGRPLTSDLATAAIYLSIAAAAVFRVTASILSGSFDVLLIASGACWMVAFGLFSIRYGRLLLWR